MRFAASLVAVALALAAAGCRPPPSTPPTPPVGDGGTTPPSGPPAPRPSAPQPGQFYPGADASAAAAEARRQIDEEVRQLVRGKHGELPPVDQLTSGGMGVPTVEVANDTQAFLMVLFSGACSAKVLVPPGKRAVGTLCAGDYTLAARLLSGEIQPYVRTGQTFVDGSTYRLTFFVIWQPGSGPRGAPKR